MNFSSKTKKPAKKVVDKKLQQLIKQDRAEKARFKHLKIDFKENRFGPLLFALLFAGLGAFFVFRGSAAPQPTVGNASANMWLVPATQTVSLNGTVTAEIWVDSGSQAINAVQANLQYPTDRLQFKSIDTGSSSFGIGAEAQAVDGKVIVARGNTSQLTGKQLVAKVSFRAVASNGQADLVLTKDSRLLRSSDNMDILSRRDGSSYMLAN